MSPFIIISASLGYAVESIFGFGGSVITFLLLTTSIPSKEAVSMLPVFALVGSLLVVLSDLKSVRWKVIGKLCLFAVPGLVLGTLFMSYVPEKTFNIIVLAIIFIYGVNLIIGREPEVPQVLRKPLYTLAGFVMGATSIGVFFIPVIGAELGHQRAYRASLGLLWTNTAICRVPLYYLNGVLTVEGIESSLIAAPFLLVAIILGFLVHRIIPESHYRRYIGAAIVLTAVVNLTRMFI